MYPTLNFLWRYKYDIFIKTCAKRISSVYTCRFLSFYRHSVAAFANAETFQRK